MSKSTSNPMDNIVVRPLRFDLNNIQARDPVWSRTSPLFSIYINALGVHVPYFERYLVQGLRSVRDKIEDPKLKKDVTSIIGQEAHHARNFVDFNKFLMERYPEIVGTDKHAKEYFEKSLARDDTRAIIGFIAGFETFTYLGGLIILDGYDKWLKDADPLTRAMWVWHQVEEVEHGAVAFEVYKYFYSKHEWYRKWMVIKALTNIARETWSSYIPMCRREGYFSNPVKALKAVGFYVNFSWKLVKNALPVFTRKYHPRQISDDHNNPLARAWREKYAQGDDVRQMESRELNELSRAAS